MGFVVAGEQHSIKGDLFLGYSLRTCNGREELWLESMLPDSPLSHTNHGFIRLLRNGRSPNLWGTRPKSTKMVFRTKRKESNFRVSRTLNLKIR